MLFRSEDGGKRRNAAKKKELEAAEKRISELSAIFKRLYEDSVSGRISDERFTELSADYEAEQQELKERVARIQAELSKAQEATVNAEKFMNIVRKHMNFEELTHTSGKLIFSIHALLAESDFWRPMPLSAIFRFLSTLSLRRATG